jgi:hypothetical protein
MCVPFGTMFIQIRAAPNVSCPWCAPCFILVYTWSNSIEQNRSNNTLLVNQWWPLTSDTYRSAQKPLVLGHDTWYTTRSLFLHLCEPIVVIVQIKSDRCEIDLIMNAYCERIEYDWLSSDWSIDLNQYEHIAPSQSRNRYHPQVVAIWSILLEVVSLFVGAQNKVWHRTYGINRIREYSDGCSDEKFSYHAVG